MAFTNATLLIVDDDPSIRNTLTQIFTELGYRVRSAWDGFSALVLIDESKPHLLLSDLNMPGMSGFELLSVVRRTHPTIHVIATSGAFQGKDVPHGISADAIYEKASGLEYLLDLVHTNALSESAPHRSLIVTEPMWMTPSGQLPSAEFYVLLSCPRCLRAFTKVLVDECPPVCATNCVHCHEPLRYAIVPPDEPGLCLPPP